MASFLIYYSNAFRARTLGRPKVGTTVEINTLEDLDSLMEKLDGTRLVLTHKPDRYTGPNWTEYFDILDEDAKKDNYIIDTLPDDWESMRWIEVYNGYRQ